MYINEKSIFWESFSELDKLYEAAQLNEDIAAVKKNFPSIDDDIFMELISLDPTYKDGRDSVGNYGKWILNLFNKNKLKQDEFDSVTDALTDFEEKKKWLANKDIGQFKSLDELQTALENVEVGEVSHARQVKDVRKAARNTNLVQDTDIVFDDNDWIVYTPKTYAASCKLGQNTSWCTATKESDEYYKRYTSDGPLYIIINKHNDKEKYQLHFETDSYMDADDEEINTDNIFSKDPELLKAIKNKFQKAYDLEVDNNIKHFVIPDGYTMVSKGIFSFSSKVESIEIPSTVKIINDNAFDSLIYLKSVVLHEGLKEIGEWAFASCSVTQMNFPQSLRTIDDYAFSDCNLLETVTFKEGLISLGNDVFAGCDHLSTVTLPASLKELGDDIFARCSMLTDIYYNGTRTEWNRLVENTDNPKLTSIRSRLIQIHCKDDNNETKATLDSKNDFKLLADGKTIEDYNGNSSHIVIPDGIEYTENPGICSDKATTLVVPKSFKGFYTESAWMPNLKYILYEGTIEDWKKVFNGWENSIDDVPVIFNWNEKENGYLFN